MVWSLISPVFLDGSNTVSRRLGFKGKISALGIRFYPGGAYPFLGVPLHEVSNYFAIADILPRQSLHDLYSNIVEAQSIAVKISHIERWLLQRLQNYQEQDRIVPFSLKQIEHATGQVSMKQLADDLYISQRQLERLYKTQVGMTPVQYARLIRVQKARSLLKVNTQLSTARIGAELGFYDQSHFIRDFKSIIGITPNRYRQYSLRKTTHP